MKYLKRLLPVVAVLVSLMAFQNCGSSHDGSTAAQQAAADASSLASNGPNNGVVDPVAPPTTDPTRGSTGTVTTTAPPVIPATAFADIAVRTNNTCPSGFSGGTTAVSLFFSEAFCARLHQPTDTMVLKNVTLQTSNATCPAGFTSKGIYSGGNGAPVITLCVQYQPVASATQTISRLRSGGLEMATAPNYADPGCHAGETRVGSDIIAGHVAPICMTVRVAGLPSAALGAPVFAPAGICPTGTELVYDPTAIRSSARSPALCYPQVATVNAGAQVVTDVRIANSGQSCPAGYAASALTCVNVPAAAQTLCVKMAPVGMATQVVSRMYASADGCDPKHTKVGDLNRYGFVTSFQVTSTVSACVVY